MHLCYEDRNKLSDLSKMSLPAMIIRKIKSFGPVWAVLDNPWVKAEGIPDADLGSQVVNPSLSQANSLQRFWEQVNSYLSSGEKTKSTHLKFSTCFVN